MSGNGVQGRERREKIIQAIYECSGGTTRPCAYEDIVVTAWKMWPEEFGLRGYTDLYPDASDLHKPLYGPLKREGLVQSRNKRFGLTERGRATVEHLRTPGPVAPKRSRITRGEKAELLRLLDRPILQLIGNPQDILDTDVYDFYGVTVRTSPSEFAGRIATVDAAIDAAVEAHDPAVHGERLAMVVAARDAVRARYGDLIAMRSAAKQTGRN